MCLLPPAIRSRQIIINEHFTVVFIRQYPYFIAIYKYFFLVSILKFSIFQSDYN